MLVPTTLAGMRVQTDTALLNAPKSRGVRACGDALEPSPQSHKAKRRRSRGFTRLHQGSQAAPHADDDGAGGRGWYWVWMCLAEQARVCAALKVSRARGLEARRPEVEPYTGGIDGVLVPSVMLGLSGASREVALRGARAIKGGGVKVYARAGAGVHFDPAALDGEACEDDGVVCPHVPRHHSPRTQASWLAYGMPGSRLPNPTGLG